MLCSASLISNVSDATAFYSDCQGGRKVITALICSDTNISTKTGKCNQSVLLIDKELEE